MFKVRNKSKAKGGNGNNRSARISNTPPAKTKSGLLKIGERTLFFNLFIVGLSSKANCLIIANNS